MRPPDLTPRRSGRPRLPPWEIELIVRMYEEGIFMREIAEAARVSIPTVRIYLREARAAAAGWDAFIGLEPKRQRSER
jgi:DNA-binding NarL/FixJ family response regulator